MRESRPILDEHLSGLELLRWYWLRSELAALARSLNVPARPAPPALPEPLTAATSLPVGQRCTQQLRRYFTAILGPSFSFDAAMRDFISEGAGRTLGDAITHWHATRSRPAPEIGSQFELNAFIRDWHHRHPRGSRTQALTAWRVYRALPVDARLLTGDGTS